MGMTCPVCEAGKSAFHAKVDGYDYAQCGSSMSLYIATDVLADIDNGISTRLYDGAYWNEELCLVCMRARGESLTRVGETLLYCQRPVTRFLDVGTGPGYLLDELARQYPGQPGLFHGAGGTNLPSELHGGRCGHAGGGLRCGRVH